MSTITPESLTADNAIVFERLEFRNFTVTARYNKRDGLNKVITKTRKFYVNDQHSFNESLDNAKAFVDEHLKDRTVGYVWVEKVSKAYDEVGNYVGLIADCGMWNQYGYNERPRKFYPLGTNEAQEGSDPIVTDLPTETTNSLD